MGRWCVNSPVSGISWALSGKGYDYDVIFFTFKNHCSFINVFRDSDKMDRYCVPVHCHNWSFIIVIVIERDRTIKYGTFVMSLLNTTHC